MGISYGCSYIFKEEDINYFKFPILNFHTGKIPGNRGKTPLFWDIYDSEEYSYGTLHAINSYIDMGIVLDEVRVSITGQDNPRTLAKKLINEIIDKNHIIKWLTAPIKDINEKKEILSNGLYKKAFAISTNYQSKDLKLENLKDCGGVIRYGGKLKLMVNIIQNFQIEESQKPTK